MIDYQAASLWLSIGNSIAMIGMWFSRRGAATQAAIDRVETRAEQQHADQERRIVTLETEIRHAIGKDDLGRALDPLYEISRASQANIAALSATLSALEKSQETQANNIERLLERQSEESRDLKNEYRDLKNMIMQRGIDR